MNPFFYIFLFIVGAAMFCVAVIGIIITINDTNVIVVENNKMLRLLVKKKLAINEEDLEKFLEEKK